uniref:Uncharacterized protein n=1 Tax=Rhizophora mucronata TaxID=61149 RepID=A0A2P2P130_RHIMU
MIRKHHRSRASHSNLFPYLNQTLITESQIAGKIESVQTIRLSSENHQRFA